MISTIITIGLLCSFILGVEWVCWMIFEKRYEGFRMPSLYDKSSVRIMNQHVLRVFIICHAMLLTSLVALFTLLIW
jgi:hypothetical protein